MIESKDVIVEKFLQLATQFEKSQSPMIGMDLDSAVVTLKRYLLSVEKNEDLGIKLGRLNKLVRSRDMDAFSALLTEIRAEL